MNRKINHHFRNSKSSLPESVRHINEIADAERLLFLQVWFNRRVKALFTNQFGEIVINKDGSRPIESGDLPPLPDTRYRDEALALVTGFVQTLRLGKLWPMDGFWSGDDQREAVCDPLDAR